MQDISVIMLTYNEERHIRRALENSQKFARQVFVVDCFSTDRTVEIARQMGAHVVQHEWEQTQSRQFAWALNNIDIETEWVFRLDADEYLTDELISEIETILPQTSAEVNGFTAERKIKFLGREIRHGMISMIVLRLFRPRYAKVENKMMDEHIVLIQGEVQSLKGVFFDESLITLSEWTTKHNGYASREALDLLATEYELGIDSQADKGSGAHTAAVRAKKLKYARMPLFWRCLAFFLYRYILRLGFLDGREGFLWHFLQGFWYRTLADAKVYEIKKQCGFDKARIRDFVIKTIQ